jgi:membrane fusion protein, multidrug efflux system
MSPRRRSVLVYVAGVGAALLTVLGVITLDARRKSSARADAQQREATVARGPRVRVAAVHKSPGTRHLVLQGEARAFAEVTLYAKVAGYLRDLRVDKGDRVRTHQILATVIAPELDQQYDAAVADARNKRVNARRLDALAPSGVVSAQELDQGRTSAAVAEANQASLATQRNYRVIRAPFNGIVTARFADPGTLIQNAGSAQSGAVPIVSVAKGERLRVYVYLDQASAPFVRGGDVATIRVPERPGWSRKAQVTRSSGALSPRTRTMQTEVDIDNADGAILPGSYVDVELAVTVPSLLEMPAEALVLRGEKTQVALIDAEGHVRYRPVVVADDDGQTVRLVSGVVEGERVALNLGNEAEEGGAVQVVEAPPPSATPGATRAPGAAGASASAGAGTQSGAH